MHRTSLQLNLDSSEQKLLGRSARFYPARLAFSAIASTLGFLPTALQNALIRRTIGKEWDNLAIDVTRRYMMNVGKPLLPSLKNTLQTYFISRLLD
jgi:hypothetical protein